MRGVSSDAGASDGRPDRSPGDDGLHRLSHAAPPIEGDPDHHADEAVRPVLPQPRDRHLSWGGAGGAVIQCGETKPIAAAADSGRRLGPDGDDAATGVGAEELAGDLGRAAVDLDPLHVSWGGYDGRNTAWTPRRRENTGG